MTQIHRISLAADSGCPSGPCLSCSASTTQPRSSTHAKQRKKVGRVVRFLLFLLSILTVNRPGQREAGWYRAGAVYGGNESGALGTGLKEPAEEDAWPSQPGALPPGHSRPSG